MSGGASLMLDSGKALATGKPKTKEEYLRNFLWTSLSAAASGGLDSYTPIFLKGLGPSGRRFVPAIGLVGKLMVEESVKTLTSDEKKDIDKLKDNFYDEMGGTFYVMSLAIQRRHGREAIDNPESNAAIMDLVIELWFDKLQLNPNKLKYKAREEQTVSSTNDQK